MGPLVGNPCVGLDQLGPRLGHRILVSPGGQQAVLHGVHLDCQVLVDGSNGQCAGGAGTVLQIMVCHYKAIKVNESKNSYN